MASLVAQRLKRLPAVWETRIRSLGWKDPLEKEMATHSSILAWEIPWTEEPDGLQSMRLQRVGHDWATSLHFTSLVAQSVKNLPVVKETWVWSLGWEDPLEKEMTTHSSILAWKISWTQEPGGLQSMGLQRVGHNWVTNTYLMTHNPSYNYTIVYLIILITALQKGTSIYMYTSKA